MDFRHIADKKSMDRYVAALLKQSQKSQESILEEMRIYLSDYAKKDRIDLLKSGNPILPLPAEDLLKVKRRRPRRR